MRSLRALMFAICGLLSIAPATVAAKCESGTPIDYDDVDAVLLTTRYRALDGFRSHHIQPGSATIEASTFWVLFWKQSGIRFPTQYSQFTLPGSIGTYELSASLEDAVALLRRNRFFELAPREKDATDQTYSVLTVRRCAVVTRIIVANGDREYQDAATAKLFGEFWKLIGDARKKKLSDEPEDFHLTLIFDQ